LLQFSRPRARLAEHEDIGKAPRSFPADLEGLQRR
jgi:hypothetical protein